MLINKIKNLNNLQNGEDYLVFLGYNYSPSGFEICRFENGRFETQANSTKIKFNTSLEIFEIPIPKINK